MAMHGTHIEVGIKPREHILFPPLPELGFPPVLPVVVTPIPVGLAYLPISRGHLVALAVLVVTPELVDEVHRDLFKRRAR